MSELKPFTDNALAEIKWSKTGELSERECEYIHGQLEFFMSKRHPNKPYKAVWRITPSGREALLAVPLNG